MTGLHDHKREEVLNDLWDALATVRQSGEELPSSPEIVFDALVYMASNAELVWAELVAQVTAAALEIER